MIEELDDPPPLVLDRDDLAQCLPMVDAIAAVREALEERWAHTLTSLPRTTWEVPPSAVTITPGGLGGRGIAGFRVYLHAERQDQLTAVWSLREGRLEGILVGPELGALRTGALGGVAVDCMASRDVSRAGLLGGGPQARAQLLAIRAVRPKVSEVRLYRRDPGRREEVARRWSREFGIDVAPAPSARAAVEGAHVVVLATDSTEPVVRAAWLARGAHVSSLGPKYVGRSEIDLEILAAADWLACDFPEQYAREKEFMLTGSPHRERLRDLAELAHERPARPPEIRTVYLSHGLAGTEVAVAHRAIENARRLGLGRRIERRRESD